MPSDSPDDLRYSTGERLRRHAIDACEKLSDRLCKYLWQRREGSNSMAETCADLDDTGRGEEVDGRPRFTLRH